MPDVPHAGSGRLSRQPPPLQPPPLAFNLRSLRRRGSNNVRTPPPTPPGHTPPGTPRGGPETPRSSGRASILALGPRPMLAFQNLHLGDDSVLREETTIGPRPTAGVQRRQLGDEAELSQDMRNGPRPLFDLHSVHIGDEEVLSDGTSGPSTLPELRAWLDLHSLHPGDDDEAVFSDGSSVPNMVPEFSPPDEPAERPARPTPPLAAGTEIEIPISLTPVIPYSTVSDGRPVLEELIPQDGSWHIVIGVDPNTAVIAWTPRDGSTNRIREGWDLPPRPLGLGERVDAVLRVWEENFARWHGLHAPRPTAARNTGDPRSLGWGERLDEVLTRWEIKFAKMSKGVLKIVLRQREPAE